MSTDSIYTTCRDQAVPLSNIDYVGRLVSGNLEDDHYVIHLKSGKELWVSYGRDYRKLEACRKELLKQFTYYIETKK